MKIILFIIIGLILSTHSFFIKAQKNDWEKENLKGNVKKIETAFYFVEVDSGNIIKDKQDEVFIDIYDINGNKIEMIIITASDTHKTSNKYDSIGNLIEITYCNSNCTYKIYVTNKFDQKRNIIEQIEYTTDENQGNKHIYKYDSKGYLIEEKIYDSNGKLIRRSTYKIDNQGNRIEIKKFKSNGKIEVYCTIIYDSNRNEIEKTYYDSKEKFKSKITYQYELDNYGNWIKHTEFENGKPRRILERIIEYY